MTEQLLGTVAAGRAAGLTRDQVYDAVTRLRLFKPDVRIGQTMGWGRLGLCRLRLAKELRDAGCSWRLIQAAATTAELQGWAGWLIVRGQHVTHSDRVGPRDDARVRVSVSLSEVLKWAQEVA